MNLSNAVGDAIEFALSFNRLNRREFLLLGGGLGLSAAVFPSVLKAASGPYRVGVGHDTSPYAATQRAIQACGEWPLLGIAGKVVVIKPNLVSAKPASSGATTDPEVVRAVVDLALAGGATMILIVEASGVPTNPPNFAADGYSFFTTYDPGNRIRLVDMNALPISLLPIPGWIYSAIYAPPLVLRRDFVFINIAKLKTHGETLATLTTKNVFGVPYVGEYISSPSAGRFGIHDRGLDQAIIDLNILRPSDFAIVDGVIGMEGLGPNLGTPVEMDIVLAGRNTVAVDRVGLASMGIPQNAVRYLNYTALFNMGPASLSQIAVLGDSFTPKTFQLPATPPNFDPPKATPATFNPTLGQTAAVQVKYYSTTCLRTVVIEQLSDVNPTQVNLIQTLLPWSTRNAGFDVVTWDGRAQDGTIVPPGKYAVHVQTIDPSFSTRHGDATGWITVAA